MAAATGATLRSRLPKSWRGVGFNETFNSYRSDAAATYSATRRSAIRVSDTFGEATASCFTEAIANRSRRRIFVLSLIGDCTARAAEALTCGAYRLSTDSMSFERETDERKSSKKNLRRST